MREVNDRSFFRTELILTPDPPMRAVPVPRLLGLSIAALLAASLAGCGSGGPEGAGMGMPTPQVTVVTLQAEPLVVSRELSGRAEAVQVAEVRPQVSGIVRERLFEEGGAVKAGQPLYQLDDATYRAEQAAARAALARAEANLAALQLSTRRTLELAKVNAVSTQDAENATAALKTGEADVAAARAALQARTVTLDYARISAPISGRIGRSSVTTGALVTANQTMPLATIHQLDPIHVNLTQSVDELLALRRALAAGRASEAADVPVQIQLDDGTPYPQEGRLAFSEVSVDPGTGRFALRVEVPNPDGVLLPGMYLRANVALARRDSAILVPQQGVQRDPKGAASVMVVNAEGVVEVRPITVSQTVGDRWLVESGLAAGDRVIVEGVQKVQPGTPAQAIERGAAPQAAAPASPSAP